MKGFLLFDIRKPTQKQPKTNPKHHPKFMGNQLQSMEIHEIIVLIDMIILWSHYQACPRSTAKFTAHMHTHRWSLFDGSTSRCARCTLLKHVLMFTGFGDADIPDAELASKEEGQDPVDKVCIACRRHRAQRTPYELKQELPLLMWGLPKGWGDFCHWCGKAGKLRWGWWTRTSLGTFVEKSETNRLEVMDYGIAMVTLRCEGRVQISLDVLETRKQTLAWGSMLKLHNEASIKEVWLLEEFHAAFPAVNPVEKSMEIVPINLGGVQRLGVAEMMTLSNDPPLAWPGNVNVDRRITCTHESDRSLLRVWASAAPETVNPRGVAAMSRPASSLSSPRGGGKGSGGRGRRKAGGACGARPADEGDGRRDRCWQ